MGTIYGEFWTIYQKWEEEWDTCDSIICPSLGGTFSFEDPYEFTSIPQLQDSFYHVPQIIRSEPKIQRNELCPCGSGLKYKNCHYGKSLSND